MQVREAMRARDHRQR